MSEILNEESIIDLEDEGGQGEEEEEEEEEGNEDHGEADEHYEEEDNDEEEDPRTPLLTNQGAGQSQLKTPSFNELVFNFPSMAKRSILKKPREVQDLRLDISNARTFLTVPTNGAPVSSPFYSTSTPLEIPLTFFGESTCCLCLSHLMTSSAGSSPKVSFHGDVPSPAVMSRTHVRDCRPPTSLLDSTRLARTAYLHTVLSVLTEALLPMVSIVACLLNVLQLFFLAEFSLGCVGLVLFLLPTVLVLFYYLENMFHRKRKLLELGLITGIILYNIQYNIVSFLCL